MNALPPTTATEPEPSPTASPPGAPAADARLSHLFRASLKSGRIHPLYLPILRYRSARAGS